MSNPQKCKGPACSCIPKNGESFCTPHCEGTKGGHRNSEKDSTILLGHIAYPYGDAHIAVSI
jgi:hypothetical protein